MKILITGANGQLGMALNKNSPKLIQNQDIEIINTFKSDLDLGNEFSCIKAIEKISPDWVINCGAYTAVDKAEVEQDKAFKTNGYGPYYIAKILKKTGGKLIHISTDFVFDGKSNRAYDINEPVNPINIYGKSKALAEFLLTKKENDFKDIFIIRTSWIISSQGQNFFLKIMKLLSNKETLKIVNDQIGCITNAANLAKICWSIISNYQSIQLPHLMHFSDSGICTWYDVAKTIRDFAYKKRIIAEKPNIIPVNSNYFNLPAKRPYFSLLNSQKTYELFKYYPPHWRENIETLIDSLNNNFIDSF